jgi:hypothetical protein
MPPPQSWFLGVAEFIDIVRDVGCLFATATVKSSKLATILTDSDTETPRRNPKEFSRTFK